MIVLLILAGTAISISINGGDLFGKSENAVNRWNNAALKEEVAYALNFYWEEPTLEGKLKKINGVDKVEKANGLSDVCYVTKGKSQVTVYSDGDILDGEVSIWNGEIECPEFKKENNVWNWYIYTAGQLKFLADFVNNGDGINIPSSMTSLVPSEKYDASSITMTTDTTIYLMNNLDLGARPGTGATEEAKWETTANEAVKWMPIGGGTNSIQLIAKFEGNNHTIRGAYVQGDNFAGIFGYSSDINYLTIKNSYIKGAAGVGGIVGISAGEINNCHNTNTIVTGTGIYVGGIAGRSLGTAIGDCSNSGTVTGTNNNVGGIVGQSTSTISDCNNSGAINGVNRVGGIVGQSTSTISGCNNSGATKGTSYVGGIAGYTNTSSTVSDCSNSGKITGETYTGGIVGLLTSTITDCNNSGATTGTLYVGGIAGYTNTSSTVSGCNNSGTITVTGDAVGGIVGLSNSTITDCSNSGKITGEECTGGIAGYTKTSSTVSDCNNSGEVKGTDCVGGIVGVAGSIVKQCGNTGNVEGTYQVGGITGGCITKVGQDISLCYNSGEVKGTDCVGGISGYLGALNSDPTAKEDKCYNNGRVINTGNTESIGGIAGEMAADAIVTNCYYLSSIGVARGIGTMRGSGGDLDAQNAGATATNVNLNSYEEFITWIEQQ